MLLLFVLCEIHVHRVPQGWTQALAPLTPKGTWSMASAQAFTAAAEKGDVQISLLDRHFSACRVVEP